MLLLRLSPPPVATHPAFSRAPGPPARHACVPHSIPAECRPPCACQPSLPPAVSLATARPLALSRYTFSPTPSWSLHPPVSLRRRALYPGPACVPTGPVQLNPHHALRLGRLRGPPASWPHASCRLLHQRLYEETTHLAGPPSPTCTVCWHIVSGDCSVLSDRTYVPSLGPDAQVPTTRSSPSDPARPPRPDRTCQATYQPPSRTPSYPARPATSSFLSLNA